MSDKARGTLGKADLDLALYGENEFKIIKLPLMNCKYEGAFIEVGLKGTINTKAAKTPTAAGNDTQVDGGSGLNSSMLTLLEDFEKLKKEKTTQQQDYSK